MASLGQLTSWKSNWKGLKVAVLGLGQTGFSVADTLAELESDVRVFSNAADPQLLEILEVLGVGYLIDPSDEVLVANLELFAADLVVVSPGIAPSNRLVSFCQQQQKTIWSDVDLAWRLRDRYRADQQWICITGTNGKTTTTELVEAMLQAAGVAAVACGNIGKPILDAIRDPAGFEVLVVELSSFQLHYIDKIYPHSAVVLNVAEDHLDWHGDMQRYRLSKGRVYENTKVACVYNLEDPTTMQLVEQAEVVEGARAIGFGLGTPKPSNVGYVDDILVDRAFLEQRADSALEIASFEDLTAFGILTPHLLSNIAAATALARSYGVSPAACRKALREFHISPHRIELVAELDGVRYVNDSKATNAHAAAASLGSFESVVWIVGGLLKGVDIEPLIERFAGRLRGVAIIGRARDEIVAALKRSAPMVLSREIEDSKTVMKDAVNWASSQARSGDVVLLAPAAASMDQFVNYQQRGDSFRAAVGELAKS